MVLYPGAGKKKKKKKKKGAAVAAEDRKTKPTAHARRLKEHLDLMKAQEVCKLLYWN